MMAHEKENYLWSVEREASERRRAMKNRNGSDIHDLFTEREMSL